ncbi:ATP-dependent DNA helicase [Lichenicoccus roseus]|uniref:ATP-dependent DNA helicase n=1 Tax=Lichenicoccus roseus TaxID=2683649 RepID=A0A5R9JAJ2_9PROT|nr:ATP-dependent DNA helicase [Lichenicoccus roseus]TLU73823.1 ATP-dependent DNA helicase [Lichenicoccus roseus]
MPEAPMTSHDPPPALVAGHGRTSLLTPDGELLELGSNEALAMLRTLAPPLVVHAPATLRRLGGGGPAPHLPTLDLLELFAFVMPARSVAPTPRGLAQALDLTPQEIGHADAGLLPQLAGLLMQRAAQLLSTPSGADIPGLLQLLGQAGWSWAPMLGAVLARQPAPRGAAAMPAAEALRVWRRLPKWEETAPRPAPGQAEVAPQEARTRLARLLGPQAESRPGQADYADAAAEAFRARLRPGDPHLVLAEAGTGTGKTLGYVAPSSLWAERNGGAVWISTYTRHLQRQIETELARLHPDIAERRRRVVLRKGRENYLCLLNLEEAVNAAAPGAAPSRRGAAPASLIPLALLARWAAATGDGDVLGGDLPGWFAELFGQAYVMGVADRRGECIHGACPHYQRCYIEHGIRRARQADLVVANHALVLTQAAWHAQGAEANSAGGTDEDQVPTRYVFDEGHHLPDAADSAFSAVLSGIETAELRRWLLGAEGGRSRARGLKRRLDDLVLGQPALETPLDAALLAARALPAPGWSLRLADVQPELPADAGPANPSEALLRLLRLQVLARMPGAGGRRVQGGQSECDLHPVPDELADAAATLERALGRIVEPLLTLVSRLGARLEEEADSLDATTRGRIEALGRTIRRRAIGRLEAWIAMLRAIPETPQAGIRPDHVMFLRLDRRDGGGQPPSSGDRDVGLHRHWLDPSVPFAAVLAAPAHGMLITSATLRDESGSDAEMSWAAAEARVGASHLPSPALRASLASPFDYARQTRTFVVNDVAQDDPEQLAGAYRALFLASGGGGLGLFTAISRLRLVHRRIAAPLDAAGIPLFAQHVDAMDNATLVDVFRTETDSCLLGTDAMRDGVDVPGHALRLVVFERVPWPRPDILHRERRIHLSGGAPSSYDDRIARLRLRQAFGRLIRSSGDVGVFVLLDRRTPSRLLSAFPSGVIAERTGLADAVAKTASFLATSGRG